MFDELSPWTWVAAAWAQLAIAYGGYFWYLRGRAERVRSFEEDTK